MLSIKFYLSVGCFWGCFCSQKEMKFLTKGGVYCFSGSSGALFFMRGRSLAELTEHDDSAADIMIHSMYTYMYCCIHST